MAPHRVVCWEPTELGTPILEAARSLYERTIDPDERIPWMWIERAVAERPLRRPTGWAKHLLLASEGPDVDDPRTLVGYAYGAFIPGFGGYLCYVGVAESARRLGVGTRLFDSLAKTFAADAALAGEPLPFVLWESYRPTTHDSEELHRLWAARARTFDRAGGLWVEGVELATPDYDDPDPIAEVPLQLFLKPVDDPVEAFPPQRLADITRQLLEKVYHEKAGDWFHERTMASVATPRLRPAAQSILVTA
jgi:GNAT superfamily N-acetyltransferase